MSTAVSVFVAEIWETAHSQILWRICVPLRMEVSSCTTQAVWSCACCSRHQWEPAISAFYWKRHQWTSRTGRKETDLFTRPGGIYYSHEWKLKRGGRSTIFVQTVWFCVPADVLFGVMSLSLISSCNYYSNFWLHLPINTIKDAIPRRPLRYAVGCNCVRVIGLDEGRKFLWAKLGSSPTSIRWKILDPELKNNIWSVGWAVSTVKS